jgi:hypothetical protein
MPTKTVRLQFEIPEDRLDALDELMEKSGMRTRTELFNNATTLLGWAITQRENGRAIASVDHDDKSFRELEMPIFSNVKAVKKKEVIESRTENHQ